jgi:hypothetical protein
MTGAWLVIPRAPEARVLLCSSFRRQRESSSLSSLRCSSPLWELAIPANYKEEQDQGGCPLQQDDELRKKASRAEKDQDGFRLSPE